MIHALRFPRFRNQARCSEVDPDLWFPEPGGSSAPAKRICLGCEARTECLEFAIQHGEKGVWGGLSEEQRRATRNVRDSRRPAA